MKEHCKQLAVKAGFEPWGDEPWKPIDEVFDWASSYDKELERFYRLIVQDCIENVKLWEKDSRNHISYMLDNHYKGMK